MCEKTWGAIIADAPPLASVGQTVLVAHDRRIIAGTLTTLPFVPQVLKTFHSKRCDDLSRSMLESLMSVFEIALKQEELLLACWDYSHIGLRDSSLSQLGCTGHYQKLQ